MVALAKGNLLTQNLRSQEGCPEISKNDDAVAAADGNLPQYLNSVCKSRAAAKDGQQCPDSGSEVTGGGSRVGKDDDAVTAAEGTAGGHAGAQLHAPLLGDEADGGLLPQAAQLRQLLEGAGLVRRQLIV